MISVLLLFLPGFWWVGQELHLLWVSLGSGPVSGDLIPALGWKMNNKDLGIRGLCQITVFLLSFRENLSTFELVKLDFIFTRAFF